MIIVILNILLFYSRLTHVEGQSISLFNPLYQFYNESFAQSVFQIDDPYCYKYGISTRYNPLIDIQQLGEIGILDSNCFHIHHTIDNRKQNINFLYYDCIDYEKQQIEKTYTFIGDDGNIYKKSYYLNIHEYESFWYFLGIIANLAEKQVVICLILNNKILDTQIYNLIYPNYDANLQYIYGGDLQINIDQTLFNEQISKLSYFPGNYIRYSLSYQSREGQCQLKNFEDQLTVPLLSCKCTLNKVQNIPDSLISQLNQEYFISENLNCDSFSFQTWIRIKERNNYVKEMDYQLIKISAHYINTKLLDDNLCAFQLYYKLTQSLNQIIITTYSYTFPIVNIDFSDDPFLIKKTFSIDINIQLWHFLRIRKTKNSIQVKILFYEVTTIQEYSFESIVNHFNMIRFKITYGNILQTYNYLTIQFINMMFSNCDKEIISKLCHISCLECDGPTKSDCLSCDPSTNRIYNKKQKACVCVYGKIEIDNECKDYSSFQLILSQENGNEFKCSYGYFEFDNECWKCPSKIREKLITCIECITNPKTWIINPYCQYNFVTDDNLRPFTKLDDGVSDLFFDGADIKFKENQEQYKDIYSDYIQTFEQFSNFCQNCQRDLDKEFCFVFEHCMQCEIQLFKPICTKCVMNFLLKDGVCQIQKLIQTAKVIVCETPYYQTYYNICILCPIVNCLYCFDYLKDDVQKNTIFYKYSTERINANDQQVLVGCAQCLEGYIYDFITGQCIYKQSQIQNCLRSFVNQEGKEMCILSSIDDFKVAPQIINCQKYIFHCEQCFQNIQTILKCLICEVGYVASYTTGLCQIGFQQQNEKSSVYFYDQNIWRYIVQSFTMLFAKINYSYLLEQFNNYNIECIDGYQLFKQRCSQYCDQNCRQCQKDEISKRFTCSLCSLNPYQEPYRVQEYGKCVICPSLCLVCHTRSNESIKNINPYYIINEKNAQYTTQCIKTISNVNIKIDPQLQVAQYIYDPSKTAFEYSMNWFCKMNSGPFDVNADSSENFENDFDFFYFNEIGLRQFILILQFKLSCDVPKFQIPEYRIIKNSFYTKIFSIRFVKLQLKGNLPIIKNYQIYNFNQVELINLYVNLEQNITFEFYNNEEAIDYQILNTTFISNKLEQIKFEIPMNINQICNIYNLSISNFVIDNSIMFNIHSTKQNETIFIDYFFLTDTIISNTVLFNFNTTSQNIVIGNLFIDRCEFNKFTLLNFQQTSETKISLRSIIIKNSIFTNSSFLESYNTKILFIYSFQMIENLILNSKLIKFSKDLFSFNLVLKQNQFKESILFEKQFSVIYQQEIKIVDINIISNIFQSFQVFVNDQNQMQPIKIELTNIVFKDNTNAQKEIQDYIFKLSCSNILIQNVSIINTSYLRYFYLFNISQINIKNISVQNEIQEYRIPLNQDCIINSYQHSKFLFLKGFSSLYLGFIKLFNQITIDQSFIEIQSNDQTLNKEPETIIIQNVTFTKNRLMKINQRYMFSIISIYSDKIQSIHFQNILYQENSYHQYYEDPTQSSASLLFINSINSFILLQNIQCFENSLTNSTNSFITINSNEVKIKQIQVFHHNYLRVEFWNRYYQILLQNNINQIEINYMIEQILSIKNKGGVIKIITDNFTLENGQFSYLIAKSSSVLDIVTKGAGIINLYNCSIAYSQNNLLQNSKQEGSISISSQNSYLTLRLENFNFTDVYNTLSPAILSLIPSEVSNYILIKNVQVSNCFSLTNVFLALSFPQENVDQNLITIDNIIISQSQQASVEFNRQLNILEPIIISQITKDNAIFNIQGCLLKVHNFQFEGFILSGIFNLINCKKIQLMNILFDKIIMFHSLNLLHIESVVQIKSIIQIQNLTTIEIKMFNSHNQQLSPLDYPNLFLEYKKCQILMAVLLPIKIQQLDKKLNNFEQILQYSTQNGSILYIKCSNNLTKISLQSIFLLQNNCRTCKHGLIFFELIDFQQINIEELYCMGNIIQQFGCITAQSEKKLQGKLKIRNSLFINNIGTQGIAVSSLNVKIFLFKIKIFNNTATLLGGGLYIDLNNQDFSIKSTNIQQNKASEGGGIYFSENSFLSEINFMNSLLNFNLAELTTNNLHEQPSHLDLSINHQIMPSEFKFDQISQKSLKLQPYRMMQQGKILMANILMVPSNQEMAKYELYNPKQKKFTSYINELSIQFKNRFNEQLLNFTNSTCQIIESILDIKKQTILESYNVSLIQFNQTTNKFDMGTLIFIFDPYNQTNKQYEIKINCKTKNQSQELSYNIKVKSLYCQLGEFYVLDGCLTCESNQGFYSVTYNATKCSIFDKTKFEAINSNNINLKPGFWRPHPESDLVNDCFKNIESCKGGWVVGDDICKVGHIGGLCEECDKHNIRGDGYFFQNDQYTCWNCRDFSISILSIILIMVWVFLSTFITLTSVEKTNQLFALFKLTQKFAHILFKMNLNQESILLKLFLNYIWIFSVIFTFNIKFSFSFIFVNQMSDTSYFLTRNLDCELSQSFEIELIYMRVLVMLILIALQIFLIQLGVNIFFMLARVRFRKNIISITLIYMYIQNYTALINQLFSIMANREISQINYVQGDVSLLFESSNHQTWMYRFALPVSLLIGLILPMSLLWFLYQKRNLFDKIQFRKHIGYLFNEYSNNSSFWEWIKLWKKTIIIIILIYFETNIFYKGFLIGVCLMIYQIITAQYLPYIYSKLNNLDLKSAQLCSIAIFLAAVQYLCEQQEDQVYAKILQILIILICFKFSFPYIFDIISAYYYKYKEKLLKLLVIALKTLNPQSNLICKLTYKLDQWRQKSIRIERNFKKLKQMTIQQKRKDKIERQQICVPTLSLNKSGELKFKLMNF